MIRPFLIILILVAIASETFAAANDTFFLNPWAIHKRLARKQPAKKREKLNAYFFAGTGVGNFTSILKGGLQYISPKGHTYAAFFTPCTARADECPPGYNRGFENLFYPQQQLMYGAFTYGRTLYTDNRHLRFNANAGLLAGEYSTAINFRVNPAFNDFTRYEPSHYYDHYSKFVLGFVGNAKTEYLFDERVGMFTGCSLTLAGGKTIWTIDIGMMVGELKLKKRQR